jgi:hypothetical protein
MKSWFCAVFVIAACGDDRPGADGGLTGLDGPTADTLGGDLFGEPCTQPPFPEIGICHEGEGACHDETAGSVCRPFCHVEGQAQCAARNGVEVETDRGACVCVPP